ncbi:unnamed protein product [Rotaria sordida]|uniref:Uncharacterized protein n=1 Tax=Rotaria sordida TaxID=392033 RepID=A0A813WEF0_9BILA|nr:unnamed protein product [Rotaria sordida]CAF0949057.1 unnamed protein product [Rotaria sordida]CAF0969638.1 unnamed protein product [Rotaria sordida]CAF0983850.1 unnamed protein product [Rotaria sordida]CAF3771569.1 unnamed protein product [Rotaria sordida]
MDEHISWLEEFIQEASVILKEFTNEQLDIIQQIFQQNQYIDNDINILLANQFNTEPICILLCFDYYRLIVHVDNRRRRHFAHVAA